MSGPRHQSFRKLTCHLMNSVLTGREDEGIPEYMLDSLRQHPDTEGRELQLFTIPVHQLKADGLAL